MAKECSDYLRRRESLRLERSTWVSHWTECAKVFSPRLNEFYRDGTNPIQGEKRTEFIFDSVPVQAAMTFPTVVDSAVTPRNERWQTLTASDPNLMKISRVANWFDMVTDILFRVRYQSRSNFASQKNESYYSMGIFGQGVMFIDEVVGEGIRYKSEHIYDILIAEDSWGRIDTIYREMYLTARQAAQIFTPDVLKAKCPTIYKALSETPDQKFEFLHCVEPNVDYEIGYPGPKGMKYASVHIAVCDKQTLKIGGYRTFPYVVDRSQTSARSAYAYSPAMIALADTKMLNEMSRTDLIASQRLAQPPLLLSDDGILTRVNVKPNALNIGGLDSNGNELVKALQTKARPDIAEEKMMSRRNSVKDTFLVTLFQIMRDNPQMTATQVLEESKEKAAMITPMLGRIQSESLNPMTERELDLLLHAGQLPPMPPELLEARGSYEMTYNSPLTRAQMSESALGIQRQLQFAGELIGLGQADALDIYDIDEAQRIVGKANALPGRVMIDQAVVIQRRQARAEAQQTQQMVEGAPLVGKAAKDLATAQATVEGK